MDCSIAIPIPEIVPSPILEHIEAHWYAAYTCARHEKQVWRQLQDRKLETFLPLYRSVRRWKDRRKELELPLFPGYIFVRIPRQERLRVLRIPSVVRFVGFQGEPAALEDREVEQLRRGLENGVHAEPHPYLKIGDRIRVKCGPLAGVEGILIRKKDSYRIVLSLDLLMRSVAAEVEAADLE